MRVGFLHEHRRLVDGRSGPRPRESSELSGPHSPEPSLPQADPCVSGLAPGGSESPSATPSGCPWLCKGGVPSFPSEGKTMWERNCGSSERTGGCPGPAPEPWCAGTGPRSPTGRSAPLCSERGKRSLTQRPGPRLVPQDKQPLSAPGTRQSERDRPESCERGLGARRCVARRRVGPSETGSGIRRCWHPSLAHPGKPCRPPVPPPLPVMAEAQERGSCYRPAKGSNCSTQEAGGEDRASHRGPG